MPPARTRATRSRSRCHPSRPPAVPDDEPPGPVADDGDGMPAACRLGLVFVEVAARRVGVVPRPVDVETRQDRALRRQPRPPVGQVRAQVEVRDDLELGGDRVERRRLARIELSGQERERRVPHGAELRAMSSADLRLVPSVSIKVVGRVMNWSVSFEAIQMKRGESLASCVIRPALTKCQRSRESAVAQPTQDPVVPWSPTFHQVARRSFGTGRRGPRRPCPLPRPSGRSSPPPSSATACS